MFSQRRRAARAARNVLALGAAISVGSFVATPVAAQPSPPEAGTAVTASIVAGVVQVKGTLGNDNITLELGGPSSLAIVDTVSGIVLFTFNGSDFHAINVSMLAGDDTVIGTNGIAPLGQLTINGGGGNDTLFGGDGNDVIIGGAGNDFIDGNRGNDVVSMGTGSDTFNWDPGDGSDVVEGDAGIDTMRFNGSNAGEKVDMSANGSRLLFTRDVAAVTMDVNAVESVVFNALGSADTVTINDLTGTGVTNATVDLSSTSGPGTGDGAADQVIVNGTSADDSIAVVPEAGGDEVKGLATTVHVTGGEPALDTLTVDGLAGNDLITANPSVGQFIGVDAVGGADDDTVVANGTSLGDTFGFGLNGTGVFVANGTGFFTSFAEHLHINGLGGDDTIEGQNGIAGLTQVTIDGGPGNDTLGGGDGDDLIIGDTGADVIDGNRGNDTLFGGDGNDTFVWDPGDGNDIVEGQVGTDTLRFNGSNAGEKIDLSANGTRLRLTRDIAAITMDVAGVENVVLNTLGSVDNVTVNDLTGTDVQRATIDLESSPGSGVGDGAADTVIVNGTNGNDTIAVNGAAGSTSARVTGLVPAVTVTGAEAANDLLDIDALAGTDVLHNHLAPGVIQLVVNGVP
jgi:Ca2+-binding RTX toxin-like protein